MGSHSCPKCSRSFSTRVEPDGGCTSLLAIIITLWLLYVIVVEVVIPILVVLVMCAAVVVVLYYLALLASFCWKSWASAKDSAKSPDGKTADAAIPDAGASASDAKDAQQKEDGNAKSPRIVIFAKPCFKNDGFNSKHPKARLCLMVAGCVIAAAVIALAAIKLSCSSIGASIGLSPNVTCSSKVSWLSSSKKIIIENIGSTSLEHLAVRKNGSAWIEIKGKIPAGGKTEVGWLEVQDGFKPGDRIDISSSDYLFNRAFYVE